MARYPFNLDDFPDSEYAAELRKPTTTLPFPPAMEQDYLDDHLRKRFLEESLIRELVDRDGLTGLKNRRAFEEYMQRVWQPSFRGHKTAAFLMIDVDHFKPCNDRYGHQAGDGGRLLSEAGHRETGSVTVQLQRPLPSASAPATTAAADTAWRSLDSSTTYAADGSGTFIFLRGARADATVKADARGSCRISARAAIEHT